jgi:hypothetical protein
MKALLNKIRVNLTLIFSPILQKLSERHVFVCFDPGNL